MVHYLLECQMTPKEFYSFTKSQSNRDDMLSAEATIAFAAVNAKGSTIVKNNDCINAFPMPSFIVDFVKYGNLLISEHFIKNQFKEEFVLATREYLGKVVDSEFNSGNFLKDGKQIKSGNYKDYPVMDLEDWNLFWSNVNQNCKDKFQMVPFSKEPMLLSNLGGITMQDETGIKVVNSNINNSWELAFLLGYKTELLNSKLNEVKDYKQDLSVKSYLHPNANAIYD